VSLNYKEALAKAESYDAKLRADDCRFNQCVQIISQDCATVLFYDNAFVMKDDEWYYIFTEHYGRHVFHQEDVKIRHYIKPLIDELK